jgi:ammonium transporter Rh
LAAGTLCVVGYVLIQPRVDRSLRIVDTCGVHNLHGMPGLLGGLTAALVVPGIAKAQLVGIAFTVVLAFVSGTVCGHVVAWAGRKSAAYEDDEFAGMAEHGVDEESTAAVPQAEVTLSVP